MEKILALLRITNLLLFVGLFMGMGCQREVEMPPACWGDYELKEMKRLEGVRADFGFDAFFYFEKPQELAWGGSSFRERICYDQAEKVLELKLVNNFRVCGQLG